ncbi:hypothetical protein RyT2_17060 [Pseudolactococcus yaeyamensis]
MRDKNDDKRFEYDLKIRKKEQEMDDLDDTLRKYAQQLSDTADTLQYNQEEELYLMIELHEISSSLGDELEDLMFLQNQSKHFFNEQLDSLEFFRKQNIRKLDDEREILHEERSRLPWD